MSTFSAVWTRIMSLEGETFYQVRGKPFSFTVSGSVVTPTTTNRNLPKSQFEKAYDRLPVSGPSALQDLQGPSYLFAILTDERVKP